VTGDSALRLHLPGLLLLFSFLLSLAFFLAFPPDRIRRTLFFPGATDLSLRGESRLLPRTRSQERDVALLVEDLILGPAEIDHGRVMPRGTAIRSLIVNEREVYIDLSSTAIDPEESVRLPLDRALGAIERSVIHNFRTLDTVLITIDGQVPFEPGFRETPIGN
jgi:hypothetical protein